MKESWKMIGRMCFWYLFFSLVSCGSKTDNKLANPNVFETLASLDQPLEPPRYGEWLFSHPEKGQSFQQYTSLPPVSVTSTRRIIYIQPLGKFTPVQLEVVQSTAQYLSLFFGLKTMVTPAMSDKRVPKTARRVVEKGHEQLNAPYILDSLLLKNVPADAVAIMAITAKDLYPQASWNYIFGLANTKQRVGVSSIYWYSPKPLDSTNSAKCLERLIKTSSHELGHMFSMRHCVKVACVMNGSNNLGESDQKANYLCSLCLMKLHSNLKFNLKERNKRLAHFFQTHRLARDLAYYQRAQLVLVE